MLRVCTHMHTRKRTQQKQKARTTNLVTHNGQWLRESVFRANRNAAQRNTRTLDAMTTLASRLAHLNRLQHLTRLR